ncbi:MAG: hypothetical protein ACI4MC_04335, partial [Candidatus Coproplasma sp.]
IAVALVLLVALTAGLLAHFLTKDKSDKLATDDTPQYELGGKVYDENGNEMLSAMSYAMPRVMAVSELEEGTVAQVTLSATVTPNNATDKAVDWSVKFSDGFDASDYLTIEPTYDGSDVAVLTCLQPFETTAIVTVEARTDSTKKSQCYVDYLCDFDAMDLNLNWDNNIVFGQDCTMDISFSCYTIGTVEGDLDYGDLYLELESGVVNALSEQLGFEFTPDSPMLCEGFGYEDGFIYNLTSPYACFASNSGIDEQTFNEAFTKAVYYGCGELDYHARLYFTAKYSYRGETVEIVPVTHDGYERITVTFSLEGLFIPVDDVEIDNGDIVIGVETNSVECYFDNEDGSVISTDSRIKVTGNQSTCSAVRLNELGKTVERYLKMESATQIDFSTSSDMTLKIYVDTADKRIKVDGVNYTSELAESGDIVITLTLGAGQHSITKSDVLGLYALTLKKI